jgi:hypothetical protein
VLLACYCRHNNNNNAYLSIPVAVRSRLTAGIVGSNPAEGMDVRVLCLLCVV